MIDLKKQVNLKIFRSLKSQWLRPYLHVPLQMPKSPQHSFMSKHLESGPHTFGLSCMSQSTESHFPSLAPGQGQLCPYRWASFPFFVQGVFLRGSLATSSLSLYILLFISDKVNISVCWGFTLDYFMFLHNDWVISLVTCLLLQVLFR